MSLLTLRDLKDRSIGVDERSADLLRFTGLTVDELDILLSYVPLPEGRTLQVRIGGLTYRACANDDGNLVDAVVTVHDEVFSYPLTVEITHSHEPCQPGDHTEFCPYSFTAWPVDENGEEYWADPAHMVYDEARGTWGAPEQYRHYDLGCDCPYVEDRYRVFHVEDDETLQRAAQYLAG